MLDSRGISLLRPDVAANCRLWQERCRAAGLNVLVTNRSGTRNIRSTCTPRGAPGPAISSPTAVPPPSTVTRRVWLGISARM